jgi:DNA-binding transcriptional regulator YiaG
MDKELFEKLLKSVKQMDEIRAGKRKPPRISEVPVIDVKATREKTGLSQADFARIIHVSKGTLLNWEQGRRAPTGPARALLKAVANDPEHVIRALHSY